MKLGFEMKKVMRALSTFLTEMPDYFLLGPNNFYFAMTGNTGKC